MKKRCKDIKLKLIDYYQNSLSTEERSVVQFHLDACSKCQKELEEISSTFELLKKESAFELEELYWTNFVPGVRSKLEKKKEAPVVIIPKWKIAGAVVSFVLILLLGVFLFQQDRRIISKSRDEVYTSLLPSEDEKIKELLYAEVGDESSLGEFFTDQERIKLALAEEELEKSYWEKGGREKTLAGLELIQLEYLKETLEKEKFKKEIL